jgi:hypothetical protein
MNQRYPLLAFHDTYLKTLHSGTGFFPASRIQRSLVLEMGDKDLSEEGVGFGLPVIKRGLQAVFPGSWSLSAKLDNGFWLINADFEMNLIARMARKGKIIDNGLFCQAWESFSKIHREYPQFRKFIAISSRILKKKLDLREAFTQEATLGFVRASYLISNSRIDIEISFPKIDGCTELIILNEQGASWFNTYQDSNGLILKGERIGSWDQIEANNASFIDAADGLVFTLKRIEGAKMFRGRELVADSLAWAGLAYILPHWTERFAYSIELNSA